MSACVVVFAHTLQKTQTNKCIKYRVHIYIHISNRSRPLSLAPPSHNSPNIIQFTVNAALKFVLAHMAYAQRLTPALSDEPRRTTLPHLIAEVYWWRAVPQHSFPFPSPIALPLPYHRILPSEIWIAAFELQWRAILCVNLLHKFRKTFTSARKDLPSEGGERAPWLWLDFGFRLFWQL